MTELDYLLTAIMTQEDVRTALSDVRRRIKENPQEQAACAGEAFVARILVLLEHADAKTRKNAALLLGDIAAQLNQQQQQQVTEALWNAYEKDTVKFVSASYMKAMASYDCSSYLPGLKELLHQLQTLECAPEDVKHVRELRRQVTAILSEQEVRPAYAFGGIRRSHMLLLTAEPYIREALLQQVIRAGKSDARIVSRGVCVTTDSLDFLDAIRLYRDVWFVVRFAKGQVADAQHLAEAISQSELLPLLQEIYGRQEAYPFCLRSREADSKSLKRLAYQVEEASGHRLRNCTTKEHIAELLVEPKKNGDYRIYLKCADYEDKRFLYRKSYLPTSMSPVTAAQMVELVRPYLKEQAHIIDPFCGVGTLLIERNRVLRARDTYGVDSFGEAIAKARANTSASDMEFYYINRDYFDFTSSYLLEEVITECPRMEHKSREEVDQFYHLFFDKTEQICASGAVVILLSTEENALKKHLRLHPVFALERQIPMRGQEQIYIVRKRG